MYMKRYALMKENGYEFTQIVQNYRSRNNSRNDF